MEHSVQLFRLRFRLTQHRRYDVQQHLDISGVVIDKGLQFSVPPILEVILHIGFHALEDGLALETSAATSDNLL